MEQAARGKKALDAGSFEEAVALYTAALAVSPTSPDYLIQRSTALQRAGKPSDALVDAENAVVHAQKRAKREAIIDAQFRRGCSLYSLERYGDAKFVFAIVKRMHEKHKMIDMWLGKTDLSLNKLSEDDERRKHTVQETAQLVTAPTVQATTTSSTSPKTVNTVHQASSAPNASTQTPADKIRHDWYQNNDKVFFTLLAKGVPQEKAQIEILERSLSISFPLVTGSSYDFTLDPLYASVLPETSVTRITPSKVEITLAKKTPGQKWAALEGKELPAGDKEALGQLDETVKQASLNESKPAGPSYPTSSRSGPKDWDKVTRDAQAELRDPAKKESGVDDDDFEGGDEANHFFQKLFKDASPDVRRAMMKSYTESNGTALSTNWEEVSKAKVETLPPDGMEAKNWGS